MSQPTWNTNSGSIGSYLENRQISYQFSATPSVDGNILRYTLHNGELPKISFSQYMTIDSNGILSGTPVLSGETYIKEFTIRVSEYNGNNLIGVKDRTFSIRIVAESVPRFTTGGHLGAFNDSTWISVNLPIANPLIGSKLDISVVDGELPEGLEITDSGKIIGYARPPKNASSQPITKTYNFVLKINNRLQFSATRFSMTIINQETLSNFSSRVPAILNFNHTESDKVPEYSAYYISNTNLGTYEQNSSFMFKVIGYDFDNEPFSYNITGLSGLNLSYDSATGWITGVFPNIQTSILDASISITVSKNGVSSVPLVLTLRVQGSINSKITWVTDSDLGKIANGVASSLSIVASTEQNLAMKYELVPIAGEKLPPKLTLLQSGEISGRVAFESDTATLPKNSENEYLFTVKTTSLLYSNITAQKQFKLTTVQTYTEPYDNLYMQAFPLDKHKKLFNDFISNTEIFPNEYIYRLTDSNFGKANKIIYNHLFGVSSSLTVDYINAVIKNHYVRDIILGEIKTAIAKDKNGNPIYEVVYSQIVDDIDGTSKSLAWIEKIFGKVINLFPASLVNMKKQITEQLGNLNDDSILPIWMRSIQNNKETIGFIPAFVICYTKPGYSEIIKRNIETKWKYKLNDIQFTLDRFVVDRTLSYQYDVETEEWSNYPSDVKSINDDSKNSYVLFQPTILDGVRCPMPIIGTLSNKEFTINQQYSGTITIQNATSAYLRYLPTGITYTQSFNQGNLILTLSGAPTELNLFLIQSKSSTDEFKFDKIIQVIATNACSGGVTSNAARDLKYEDIGFEPCPTPSVGALISQRPPRKDIPFNGTITIQNATFAFVNTSTVPTGLSAITQINSGSNSATITLSGTPTAVQEYKISINARNNCSSGLPTEKNVLVNANVLDRIVCTSPTINQTDISNLTFELNKLAFYEISVYNATEIFVENFSIAGVEYTIDVVSGKINIFGTPTSGSQSYNFLIKARNTNTGVCYPTNIITLATISGNVLVPDCPLPELFEFDQFNPFISGKPFNQLLEIRPATSVQFTGLPNGVNFEVIDFEVPNDPPIPGKIIDISGTPTQPTGTPWTIVLNATNACGPTVGNTVTRQLLNVNGVISSPPQCVLPTISIPLSKTDFQPLSLNRYRATITIENFNESILDYDPIDGSPVPQSTGYTYEPILSTLQVIITVQNPTPTDAWSYSITFNAKSTADCVLSNYVLQLGSGIGFGP